jgi:Ni/Fe-hydrogenase subunit HybB-like protein
MTKETAHAHPAPAPLGGKLVTPITVILGILSLIAGGVVIVRLVFGLGAVTNINDGYPWGIWIAYDLVTGSALACGGYAVAILVYIFNRGEYHPLIRPALAASLLGYLMAGVSIGLDIGRYWNGWHIFWPGYIQTGSVMFELAACITAYILVMCIEFAPVLAEKFNDFAPASAQKFKVPALRRGLDKWMFVLVSLGILLPTMHQSSIGSMVIVFGDQINPLWRTLMLPLLFLMSAITMGYAMVIFEATLSSLGFKRPMETEILARLSKWMLGLMVIWLAIRFSDLLYRDALGLAFVPGIQSFMFWVEIALFALPIALLAGAAARNKPQRLFLAAVLMALAGFVYRLNCFLIGYDTGPGWHYFPSLPELMFTVGLIAFEALAFIILVRTLPIMPTVHTASAAAAAE